MYQNSLNFQTSVKSSHLFWVTKTGAMEAQYKTEFKEKNGRLLALRRPGQFA